MSKQIWKFSLPKIGENTISMPKGAETVSVAIQDNKPVVYALVDTEALFKISRTYYVELTGQNTTVSLKDTIFLGTLMMHNDSFVIHVFEPKYE
jgi:hypothetical protein